ncbi:hypothetical protein EGW08_003527 [Elysia chlorotica]|uniref:Uncharacterized protein n=1 Tax=Elysia chlorotica TaxID=188477 RepID=A0A3S1BQ10_ELYCH|nr:hypothetical protein EGW08_003527 [Elysia chlorotica]
MPPFNIVPSPRHVYRLLLWMCRRSQFRHLLPHEGKKVRYVAVQTGSTLELQDMEEEKSEESNIDGHYTRNDVMSMLIRRYVRHIERMKIEGEDGESTSSDEQLRRQVERLGSRVEQRLNELSANTARLQRDLDKVKAEGGEAQKLQVEHYDRFIEFSGRKTSETDRYAALLNEAKLQILSRMDSERIQMERVLEHRVGTLARKLDESTISLSQQVDRLQAITARGSSPGSSSSSPLHKPKY